MGILDAFYLFRRFQLVWKARRWVKVGDRIKDQLLSEQGQGSIVPIVMPAFNKPRRTGVVSDWLKAPGESVTQGEVIVGVTFGGWNIGDRIEVPSPSSGKLLAVRVYPYDKVSLGIVLGEILYLDHMR